MLYVTDLHLHSRFSRAVSQQMTLPIMSQYAREKGLDILTVSDWTHPVWMKEIHSQIEEVGEGVYGLKPEFQMLSGGRTIRFIFTTEISSIFKQDGKLRRIHNLVFSPTMQVAERITETLVKKGANVTSDGRPIIGLSSRHLLELILDVDEHAMLIPCHIWTPHFGMYGSQSGFDSIEESFGDLGSYIYGIETGLSSDPEMNWAIPELQHRSILSFSDAHSPAKMGRETTVMELEKADYPSIRKAIMRPSLPKDKQSMNKIVYTTEFYPEEGKYHFTGHRDCKVSYDPKEVAEKGVICPVCHKRLTEGVLYRVQQVAGSDYIPTTKREMNQMDVQWYSDAKNIHPPFVKVVPLLEIVAESMEATVASQKVKDQYYSIIKSLGNEGDIVLKVALDEIKTRFGTKLADGIRKVRRGDIRIIPGYDNQYGLVKIWQEDEEIPMESKQMRLL